VTNFLTTVSGWQRYFATCCTHCPSSSWVCLLYVGLVSMCGNIFDCCGATSLCLYRCASVARCLIFEHETERYKCFFTRAHTYTRTAEGCGSISSEKACMRQHRNVSAQSQCCACFNRLCLCFCCLQTALALRVLCLMEKVAQTAQRHTERHRLSDDSIHHRCREERQKKFEVPFPPVLSL